MKGLGRIPGAVTAIFTHKAGQAQKGRRLLFAKHRMVEGTISHMWPLSDGNSRYSSQNSAAHASCIVVY